MIVLDDWIDGTVRYANFLINGLVATAPRVFTAKPQQRAGIRLINGGSDPTFRVAIAGTNCPSRMPMAFPSYRWIPTRC